MNAMMVFKAQNLGPFISYAPGNRRNTRCITTAVPLNSPLPVSYHPLFLHLHGSTFWTRFLCSFLYCFQFNSVAQSCPTLCDPINRSMPGLPVHHQLPESIQTHVHRVGDAIQPSHPLLSPFPPALNLSQHQGLFQWVNSSVLVLYLMLIPQSTSCWFLLCNHKHFLNKFSDIYLALRQCIIYSSFIHSLSCKL